MGAKTPKRIKAASWFSTDEALITLFKDWKGAGKKPPLFLDEHGLVPARIRRADPVVYAEKSGYYADGDSVTFLVTPENFPAIDFSERGLVVAGSFNDWNAVDDNQSWDLKPSTVGGSDYYMLTVKRSHIAEDKCERPEFKFHTRDGYWLPVPGDAPNAVSRDGNTNHAIDFEVTGRHQFIVNVGRRASQGTQKQITYKGAKTTETVSIRPGAHILKMGSDKPLGVQPGTFKTTFRIFAPRAESVEVCYYRKPDAPQDKWKRQSLKPDRDGVWECSILGDLDGQYYHYHISSSADDKFSHFRSGFKILDPYAMAAVGAKGPGIICDPARRLPKKRTFKTPTWNDLVICEAHIRDLNANAPVDMADDERLGYNGLVKWARDTGFYLKTIGVNAVELQPIQEFGDHYDKTVYHWGYMTANFFSPDSSYASDGSAGKQIEEFRALVDELHEQGFAVILDVVYNHTGEPNHLLHIDKYYYFDVNENGDLMNWSGTGNTLRCNTPMGKRLIVDSLKHLVEVYGVDGFRFDLAELIGLETLWHIEKEMKKCKPAIILIAEPWSFRGHIAGQLKTSGFASWNDVFREGIADYVRGNGNRGALHHGMTGSLGSVASFPAQSVNYVESHDDFTFLDKITENSGHNGTHPTTNDRRRVHLMASILFSSLGIPMISAGQDGMRSKQGVHNTYRNASLNAVDYRRNRYFSATHEYFRRWIAFRLSERGVALRPTHTPGEAYFNYFWSEDNSAAGLLFNADFSMGPVRLVFIVNPHFNATTIATGGTDLRTWHQLADHERFEKNGLETCLLECSENSVRMPPMSCGLWLHDQWG